MKRLTSQSLRMAGLFALAAGAGLGMFSPVQAQFLEPDVLVLHSVQPAAPGGFFGFMAEAIGDLNGDGASEYIIGAFTDSTGGPLAGRAYIYSGRDGALLNVMTGNTNNRLGLSVAGVGDINKDGFPDYAAGAPGRFNVAPIQNGRVVVVSGKDHSVIYDLAGTPNSLFGFDINAAGDANGDSYPDIVVGAPTVSDVAPVAGRVVVISGRDGSTLWQQDGQSEGGLFGMGVSGVGDLEGDGLAEQAVGAPGSLKAYLLNGRNGAYLRTYKPASTACTFGQFYVHASPDANKDGVPDIYIGDFCDNRLGPETGRGYVFSGASEEKLRVFNGQVAGESLGAGRAVRDLDGDGVADYIISANLSDAGANNGGRTYLLSGKTGKTLRTMTGTLADRELGFDVVPLGDVNRDGRTDFLLTGIDVAYVVAGDR